MQIGCDPFDVVGIAVSGERDYTIFPLYDANCTGEDVFQDSLLVEEETKNYFPYEGVESFKLKNEEGELLIFVETGFDLEFNDRSIGPVCVNKEGNYSDAFNKVEIRRKRFRGILPNGKMITLKISQEKEQQMVGDDQKHINLIDRLAVGIRIGNTGFGGLAFESWKSNDWMSYYQEFDRDFGTELSSLEIGERNFANVWETEGTPEGNNIYFAKGKGLVVLELEELGTFLLEE